MAKKKTADFLVYGKPDLITEITDDFAGQISRTTVKKVINAFEDAIKRHLLEAKPNMAISIRPFLGLRLQAFIDPEKTTDTVFGKNVLVPERIRCKAKSTRYFSRCLNDLRKDM